MKESQIVALIKDSLLSINLRGEAFGFLAEERFGSHIIDLIVKIGKKKIAAIEIKRPESLLPAVKSFATDLYFLIKVRYFIYTDGNRFFVFDRLSNPKTHVEQDIDDFKATIMGGKSNLTLQKVKSEAAKIIAGRISRSSKKFPRLKVFLQDFKDRIDNELKLSFDYVLFFEGGKTDEISFENQFFLHLLDNHVPDTIYRYCAFSRVFQILDENKIAMLGIPGMNDTTEPNYAENYINELDNNVWEMPPQSRAALNRRFIMSCTELSDDLMQWRLYAEDAKGACIKFQIKDNLKTNHRFYLGTVKYADENGNHAELLLLKSIIFEIKEKLFLDFKFVLLYAWRHFFKPYNYEYEKEIRLLYIHRKAEREKKWIVAEPFSIVNPMVIFDLDKDEFPLQIVEVMVGPKRPEKKLNRSQLEQMMSDKAKNIEITESELNVYR